MQPIRLFWTQICVNIGTIDWETPEGSTEGLPADYLKGDDHDEGVEIGTYIAPIIIFAALGRKLYS